MHAISRSEKSFPEFIRWGALLWLAIWIPTYWRTWGPANFVHLCDIAVILTCLGLWSGSSPLISSQAISSLVIDLLWGLDAGWRWLSGHHLIGGTEYLFDARFPLWVRLLSLFHAALPFILLAALARIGYDRRGWILQSWIAALTLLVSRLFGPQRNFNFVFTDPFLHRALGPAPIHLALTFAGLLIVYVLTHLLLARIFPAVADR